MPYRHNRVKHIDLQDILFLDSVVMKYLYAVFFALVFSGFVLPTAVAQTTMEKEIWKIDDNRQNEPVQEASHRGFEQGRKYLYSYPTQSTSSSLHDIRTDRNRPDHQSRPL